MVFEKVAYETLNPRQREIFNFQWISAALATYGFSTQRITDDWKGADFIARHMQTPDLEIRVQLKSRIHFAKMYRNKNIWIAFRLVDKAYVYPHDEVLEQYLKINPMESNLAWEGDDGAVHSRSPSKAQLELLRPYEIDGCFSTGSE